MSVEFSTFSHEVIASSHKIPGRSHFCGVSIGHGDHASPKKCCDLLGVDLIIFGFASVYCFHIEGMPQDKGDIFPATEVSNPVPGEHALDSYNDVFPEWLYSIEKKLGVGINVSVQSDLPSCIQDTEIHFSGMKIDSAIKFVLFGVESHMASSLV